MVAASYEVERKPSDAIEALICAELSGDIFVHPGGKKPNFGLI